MIKLVQSATFDTLYRRFRQVALAAALLLGLIAVWAAGRNIGSDESYYLSMIRSGEPMIVTKYNMYLQPVRDWDVTYLRYLTFAGLAIGAFVFAAGATRFFGGKFADGVLLWALNFAGPLLLVLPVNLTISYISMNLIVFNLALGLMLWAMTLKSRIAALAAALAAGALAIQLLFIQPVNLPFLGLLVLIPLLKKRFDLGAAALLGLPAGLAAYFGLVQSWPDYLAAMRSDLALQSRGNAFLIIWCYENFHTVLLAACAAGVLTLIVLRLRDAALPRTERRVLVILGGLLGLGLAGSYLGSVVFPNGWYFNGTALAVFAATAVFLAATRHAREDGYIPEAVMLIILLLPAAASFGTDLPLAYRGSFYAGWLLTAAALAIRRCRSRGLAALGILAIAIMTLATASSISRLNICTHSQLVADCESIPGTRLRINPATARQLAALRDLRESAKYLYSNDIQFWRYTILGGFERPTRLFWPQPELLFDAIEQGKWRPAELILLEFPAKKLDDAMITGAARRLGAAGYRRIGLGGGLNAVLFEEERQ